MMPWSVPSDCIKTAVFFHVLLQQVLPSMLCLCNSGMLLFLPKFTQTKVANLYRLAPQQSWREGASTRKLQHLRLSGAKMKLATLAVQLPDCPQQVLDYLKPHTDGNPASRPEPCLVSSFPPFRRQLTDFGGKLSAARFSMLGRSRTEALPRAPDFTPLTTASSSERSASKASGAGHNGATKDKASTHTQSGKANQVSSHTPNAPISPKARTTRHSSQTGFTGTASDATQAPSMLSDNEIRQTSQAATASSIHDSTNTSFTRVDEKAVQSSKLGILSTALDAHDAFAAITAPKTHALSHAMAPSAGEVASTRQARSTGRAHVTGRSGSTRTAEFTGKAIVTGRSGSTSTADSTALASDSSCALPVSKAIQAYASRQAASTGRRKTHPFNKPPTAANEKPIVPATANALDAIDALLGLKLKPQATDQIASADGAHNASTAFPPQCSTTGPSTKADSMSSISDTCRNGVTTTAASSSKPSPAPSASFSGQASHAQTLLGYPAAAATRRLPSALQTAVGGRQTVTEAHKTAASLRPSTVADKASISANLPMHAEQTAGKGRVTGTQRESGACCTASTGQMPRDIITGSSSKTPTTANTRAAQHARSSACNSSFQEGSAQHSSFDLSRPNPDPCHPSTDPHHPNADPSNAKSDPMQTGHSLNQTSADPDDNRCV